VIVQYPIEEEKGSVGSSSLRVKHYPKSHLRCLLSYWDLHEHKKVGMIFPGVNLFHQSAHPRSIRPHDNEQVLTKETHFCIRIDDFYVGEILAIGTYFVLAFHNQHTMTTQHAMCFTPTALLELHDRCVPFAASTVRRFVSVRVVGTEGIMCSCAGFNRIAVSEESFHARRIKDNTVK